MSTSYDQTLDPYYGRLSRDSNVDSFGYNSAVITKSDTVDFAAYPKAIVVTAAGDLVVLPLKAADDGAHLITFTGLSVGFILPFRVRRVMSTGSTASVASIFD